MAFVELPSASHRVPFEDVCEFENVGASPHGSTFWRRLQSCPREHLLANLLHWDPVPRALALDIGLLWHACLEGYYRQVQGEQRGQRFPKSADRRAFEFLQPYRDAEGWAEHFETVSRMLDHYFTRWEHRDRYWEILDVECMLGLNEAWQRHVGFPYTTRLDLLIKDWTGAVVVGRHVEHKSTWMLESSVLQGWTQDDQVLGQIFLAEQCVDWRALGVVYGGCIVNLTTKQKEPKSERLPVQPSPEQIRSWVAHKRFWQQYRLGLESAGCFPKNYTQCMRRFGACAFMDYCRFFPGEELTQIRRRHEQDDLPQGFRKLDLGS